MPVVTLQYLDFLRIRQKQAVPLIYSHARYLEWYSEATLGAFCNDVALVVAQRFLDGEMSFNDADAA